MNKRKIGSLLAWAVLSLLLPLAAAAASGESESSWGWWETVGRWFNLLFLFGLIFWFVRKPAMEFFAARRKDIQRQLREAAQIRQQAQKKLAEIEARVANLDQELEEIRKEARHQAELERKKIIDQATREADKIVASAHREIDGMSLAMRKDLKAYAAKLSVKLAEEKIRGAMTVQAEERVIEGFFADLSAKARRST